MTCSPQTRASAPRRARLLAIAAAAAGGALVLAACALPPAVFGQSAATRADNRPEAQQGNSQGNSQGPPRPGKGGGGMRPSRVPSFLSDPDSAQRYQFRRFYRDEPRPSPDQWANAEAFLRNYSRYRLQAYENLPENGPAKGRIQIWLYSQYKTIIPIQDQDPQLYQWKLDRMRTEDNIWYLTGRLKNAASDGEKQEIHNILQSAVRNLVDLGLKERRLHIENLEDLISQERQKLQKDMTNFDQVVEERLKTILEEGETRPHIPNRKALERAATTSTTASVAH